MKRKMDWSCDSCLKRIVIELDVDVRIEPPYYCESCERIMDALHFEEEEEDETDN
jgi:hypothetical protein